MQIETPTSESEIGIMKITLRSTLLKGKSKPVTILK